MFDKLIHEINSNSKPLSAEEELALYHRHKAGDQAAGHELVKAHFRLALVLALQHVKRGGKLEDLFQEGVLGLYKALERFEDGKGTRFASYATWWVNSFIQDFLRSQNRQVDLPSHIVDQLAKLSSTSERFVAAEHRDPTDAELGTLMCLSEAKVSKLRDHLQPGCSLDGEVNFAEGEAPLRDVIEDVHQQTAAEYAARMSDIEHLLDLFEDRLNDQERSVLSYRFGLNGKTDLTLQMTGQALKLSTARVQQIEYSAIEKLKKAMLAA